MAGAPARSLDPVSIRQGMAAGLSEAGPPDAVRIGPGSRPGGADDGDRELPYTLPGISAEVAGVPVVDAHAHIVAGLRLDTEAAMAGEELYNPGSGDVASEVYARIAWLEGFADAGVLKMVVSAWSGNLFDAGFTNSTTDLNALAWYLGTKTDFFVPFAAPSYEDMAADPAATLEALATAGMRFSGIGEIFAHGHMYSIIDNDPLYDLCALAAEWGVPICFHWSIGVVESMTWEGTEYGDEVNGVTAEANFEQLWKLLLRVEHDLAAPPRVILAHCGLGAWNASVPEEEADLPAWQERVTKLLLRFPFFYVDTAGMQTEENQQLFETTTGKMMLHPPGEAVAGWLADPELRTRVLLGTDAQKIDDSADWLNSLLLYQDFLRSASADNDAKEKYDRKNAGRVILSEK